MFRQYLSRYGNISKIKGRRTTSRTDVTRGNTSTDGKIEGTKTIAGSESKDSICHNGIERYTKLGRLHPRESRTNSKKTFELHGGAKKGSRSQGTERTKSKATISKLQLSLLFFLIVVSVGSFINYTKGNYYCLVHDDIHGYYYDDCGHLTRDIMNSIFNNKLLHT